MTRINWILILVLSAIPTSAKDKKTGRRLMAPIRFPPHTGVCYNSRYDHRIRRSGFIQGAL